MVASICSKNNLPEVSGGEKNTDPFLLSTHSNYIDNHEEKKRV
jgi:hypothetical protein